MLKFDTVHPISTNVKPFGSRRDTIQYRFHLCISFFAWMVPFSIFRIVVFPLENPNNCNLKPWWLQRKKCEQPWQAAAAAEAAGGQLLDIVTSTKKTPDPRVSRLGCLSGFGSRNWNPPKMVPNRIWVKMVCPEISSFGEVFHRNGA